MQQKIDLEDSEEDEQIEQQMTPSNMLAGLIGNPQIQQGIANFLTNIAANLFTNNSKPPQMATSLGNTPQQTETLSDIIVRLESKGVTAQDLQKLSNLPESQITMLIGMLRNL